MKTQNGFTLPEMLIVLWIGLVVAGGIGWIMNVYKLCTMAFDHVTGLMVARGLGVLLAPMGAVLGYI